jgi:O-antigen/teichoic acid export membrane protein
MSSAITKYIAHFRAINKDEDLHDVIVAGLTFEIVTGLAFSFLSLVLASFIGSTIFHRPESTSLISIASVTIFSGMLLAASQSSFVGFERMELNSFTTICQSIAQSVISSLLVFLGYGAFGATFGFAISSLVAGIIGLATFYFILFRKLKRINTERSKLTRTLKKMLHFGVPVSMSTVLGGFMTQFYGFMMVFFCSDAIIGNYRIATNFAVILAFLTFPILTVLFPAFAKVDPQNEHELLKTVFASSVKYAVLLLIPATMAIMILSKPMVTTLYGEKWTYAPLFLTLYVVGNFFAVFGSLSLGSFLTGLGETKMVMKMSIVTILFGLPLAFLLIPTLGIIGVILGNLAGIPSVVWGLSWIWKQYKVKADFESSAKIFVASMVAAATTYLFLNFIDAAEWIRLTTGGIIFLAVYIVTAPLIGAITKSDIYNLRTIFSGLGFISKLINIPLGLIEKIEILHPHEKK